MTNQAQELEPFVSIGDVAKHFSISTSTVRTWVRSGRIPSDTYLKIGNTYRFRLSSVTEALVATENRSIQVQKEPEPEPKPVAPEVTEAAEKLVDLVDDVIGADEDI